MVTAGKRRWRNAAVTGVLLAAMAVAGSADPARARGGDAGPGAVGGISWICAATLVGWGISTGLGDSLGGAVWSGLWYGNGC